MDNESFEPAPSAPATPFLASRHDGWTGGTMAVFCEILAETAVVAEACDQAGMSVSGAYALRRRDPVFAAAWDAALSIARERLADTLLARSMEGNVEQLWRGGELVGERHLLDNRLGLAILRRLDRLAETGRTVSTVGQHPPTVVPAGQRFDWQLALDALRTGDDDGVARALAMVEGHEVEGPPVPLGPTGEPPVLDLSTRCWKDDLDDVWLTDFPPPPGFDGYQQGALGDDYERACTPAEVDALDARDAAEAAAELAEEKALRDAWFNALRTELSPSC